jgi:glycosyltransferase involved in cell wall biosynthesis
LTEAFKRDLVARGIDPQKIQVVINGVDLPRYGPRPRNEAIRRELGIADELTVGYIGTHGAAHDLGNVLSAAAALPGTCNVRFLFVGDGAEKATLVTRARSMSLNNVAFVDAQPKEAMPDWWSACDVALIHLKDDAVFRGVIPSKIFEAMAMGLPLILVAPPGEATALVSALAAGLIVPAGEPRALAEAVRTLQRDEGLRRRLAQAGLAAAPRFSRQRQADEMLRVLDGVVASGAAR